MRSLLILSTLLVGCDLATTPQERDSRQWVFQMPSVHGIPGDTVGYAEYLVCADSLRKGVNCTFQGMQGTIDYAADWIYLDGKDSTIQWPHFENVGPLFVGRK